MVEISLKDFGLTQNEEKVYLKLLEIGSSSAGLLIKKTGMHRAAVYDNIDSLTEKGLVSHVIKANRKYFYAESPERLREIVEDIKKEAESIEKKFNELLPILETKRTLSQSKQEATIFEGKKGLKSVAEDVIKQGKDFLVFGASGGFQEIIGPYFWNFHRRREESKIPMKIIYSERTRKNKTESALPMTEMKFLSNIYKMPATTWVYSDRVAIILWSSTPVVFMIRSNEVSESYKEFFSILWNHAKK